jgi:hypothetical protein
MEMLVSTFRHLTSSFKEFAFVDSGLVHKEPAAHVSDTWVWNSFTWYLAEQSLVSPLMLPYPD